MPVLNDISTRAPKELDKQQTKEETEHLVKELNELQNLLYAESKHSILVILQGMDASGKDGAIKKVLGQLNPQGVMVTSFKTPTEVELKHDFLWRVHLNVPPKGMIGVFNRSHYEDVLITRVHKWCDDATAEKIAGNFHGLLNAILTSGDGLKCETGFHVITVTDEYVLLNRFQMETKAQSHNGKCDYQEFEKGKYKIPGFYFDISRFYGKILD